MILYAGVACVTIAAGLFVNNSTKRLAFGYTRQQVLNVICLGFIFLLLFAVSALRLNVGNDYAKYCEYFHLIRCKLDTPTYVPTEFGFNAVCILIYLICGRQEIYPVMFGVFALLTILVFMKAMYRQAESFPFTFFLFMTLSYYFQTFSTIRYYLALAMALYAIRYVIDREWVKFILMILVAATFHKSVLIVIPFYFLAQWTWKKWQYLLVAAFCASLFLFREYYMKAFLLIYPTYEETEYLDGGTSLINILRCVGVLVLSLLLYRKLIKNNRRMTFYFYCNIWALLLYLSCFFLPAVSRLGYYLNITHILFIPSLILGIGNAKLKKLCIILTVAAGILYLGVFLLFKAGADGLRILPYQTFLYHEMVPILSDVTN